jgi:hypothetical protein
MPPSTITYGLCLTNFMRWFRCSVTVPKLRWLVAGFPPRRPGFEPRSGHVVDKVTLRQVSSEHFGFHCRFSFHRLLHIHLIIRGWYNRSFSGRHNQLIPPYPSKPKEVSRCSIRLYCSIPRCCLHVQRVESTGIFLVSLVSGCFYVESRI